MSEFGSHQQTPSSIGSDEVDDSRGVGQPYLELPKSHLAVQDGVLLKRTPEGGVVARHPLDSVDSLEAATTFESFSLLIDLVGAGMIWGAWTWLESSWAQWILIGIGGLALLLGLVGAFGTRLVVSYKGEQISYTVADEKDAVDGFVRSVRDLLEARSGF